jgi:hypothetical protein
MLVTTIDINITHSATVFHDFAIERLVLIKRGAKERGRRAPNIIEVFARAAL